MYINFNKLHRSGITLEQLFFMCAIQQREPQEILDMYYNEEVVQEFLERGFFKRLKKGDLRMDTKGTKFLKEVSSSGDITSETEIIVDWLIQVYKSRNGGVRNKKETQRRCQWFSDETGIVGNRLAVLLRCFVQDVYQQDTGQSIEEARADNPRLQLSVLIDNIFWNPPNNFARNYTLDNSPLWNYYDEHTEYIEQVWKTTGLE